MHDEDIICTIQIKESRIVIWKQTLENRLEKSKVICSLVEIKY